MDDDSIDSTELVGTNPPQRNWRGILIALLVILIVLSLIVVAVILVTPRTDEIFIGEPFTFSDLFSSEYRPREFTAHWVGDKDVFVYRSREGEIMEYDAANNVTQLVMDNSTFRQLNTDQYWVSEDLQFVLVAYDVERIYRHSFKAKYQIFNRYTAEQSNKLLAFPVDVSGDGIWRDRKLQYAGWSSKGHALTFVYGNDIWYQEDPFTTPNRVTESGRPAEVFNGIPDWLYEEELLHSNKAHWWSADASYLAYAQIDDRGVPRYRFPWYGAGTDIYGQLDEIAYPKAGDKGDRVNPLVKLFVLDTRNPGNQHAQLLPPLELADQEHYLLWVQWQDAGNVLVAWSNRAQNRSVLMLCSAKSADCFVSMVQANNEGRGWVDVPAPRFIDGGRSYLTVLPERDGFHGFWKHIAMVSTPVGREGKKTFITQGTWDVMEFCGYDEEARLVYYIGTNGDPRKRHLFRVALPESHLALEEPECLTCDYPESCQYVSVSFAHSAQYYIVHCEGPGVPQYMFKGVQDGRDIMLEDNADLAARLQKKGLPRTEYYEVDIADGQKIWAKVLIPPTLNKEHITVYPLLLDVYGGPGTQKVTERFSLGWETYLVSSEHVVYAMVDGRGSAGRGDRWLHAVYRNLGTLEVQDQITAARFLRDSFSFVDRERVAVWGWSYGGFVSLHALGDPSDVFSCGVAVAPVTDWRYYDTAYTERYMGMANSNDNYRGYDTANVSRKAENFKGKELMIVHGTADDNVHFQHTAQFLKALTEADVDYRVQVYSDKNHALSGPMTSQHLYRTMTRFLKDACWGGGRLRELRAGKLTDVPDAVAQYE